MLRVGLDIGGTFTDITGIDEETGQLFNLKTLTSARRPFEAVLSALEAARIRLEDVVFFSHGTTLAVNALVERKGARTGVIATKGFRDVLELRRGGRTHMADPLMEAPFCYAPGRLRVEVNERIAWDGQVLEPLDDAGCLEAAGRLVEEGVESVAICLLNAYANGRHEQRASELLRRAFPALFQTVSSTVVPEIGEYERTSTAVLNAYLHPVVYRYLSELERVLRERGLRAGVHLMQSNGGIMNAAEAADRPILILESGPAAGTTAAAYVGGQIGTPNLIAFDMGGTTAKASVIEGGEPLSTLEFEVFEEPNKPGSGWPIRVPFIDIVETGAGGGSIAWVDDRGGLRVGPQSAGADPGPACYGQGGEQATVTDANVVLGRLATLLGGGMTLDVDRARAAIERHIASPLGLTVEEAAAGIIEIAGAQASDALRVVTISRGRDPRGFALMAFGGAGPLVAAYIVMELGLAQAIIPPSPGNFSALGLLSTDLTRQSSRTYITSLERVDLSRVHTLYGDMEDELRGSFSPAGESGSLVLQRYADLRYEGQFHVITVPLEAGLVDAEAVAAAAARFHKEHVRLYTFERAEDPVELVNLRVRAIRRVARPPLARLPADDARVGATGTRRIHFREVGGAVSCAIYDRARLGDGVRLRGPAVIEEQTSTTLVPPGFEASVDGHGNIFLRREKATS
jgi:N-methylhydantoinase A